MAVLGLAAIASATATPESTSISQLGIERWTRESGLAGRWVRAIAETPDGFLWVATAGGLSRFDGRDFVNYTAGNEAALPGNAISALARRSLGGLWVGFDVGRLWVLDGNEVRALPELEPLQSLSPSTLLEQPAGTLWIGTASGLWRWRDGRVDRVAPEGVEGPVEIRALAAEGSAVWARTFAHGLWRLDEGGARVEPDAPGCLGVDLQAGAGERLVTACVAGVWEREGAGAWREIDSDDHQERVFADRTGAVWISGGAGLKRRSASGRWELLDVDERLGDVRVRAFHEDSRGGLWIGSYAGGLARLRRGAVTPIGAPEGLEIAWTTGVAGAPDGSLWIGSSTNGAVRWRFDGGSVERWGVAQGMPTAWIWSVAVDPFRSERVWFGTAEGLVERDGSSLRRIARPEGRTRRAVRLLYVDPTHSGSLWVAGEEGGLDEIRGGDVVRHDARTGLGLERVSGLARLRSGELLAAGQEGLFVFDGLHWREHVPPGGTLRGVRTFTEGADGTLWMISSVHGLLRWRGDSLVSLSEREGLRSNRLYSLRLDAGGGLWMSSDDGITRLSVDDFERWAAGELDVPPTETLGERDGLRDRECNGWGRPESWRLADGRLAFPTKTGIALLDPARVARRALAPAPIFLDRAWTGERFVGRQAPWRLGSNERHLRVRFGAVEFERPDAVEFRCRMRGLDRDWLYVGTAREASYSYLPPGRYEFAVEARLPGQDWVKAAESAAVEVAPGVLESRVLRFTLGGVALFAALSLYRWRTRLRRRHDAAIARERSLLSDVIDTIPNPIFVKRRDRTFRLSNRAADGLFDAAAVSRSASTDGAATLSPALDPFERLDRAVFATGEERTLPELRLTDVEGRERWYRVYERPRFDDAGEVEEVLGTALDVTDFKLVEADLRSSQAELEAGREELRQLARRLLQAQEDECRRIARELHDDFTQRLAGLAMLIGSLAHAVEREPGAELANRIARLGEELEVLAADAQALSHDLHPYLLESLGLEEALRAECETFGERTGLEIPFASAGVPPALAPEVSLVFYRIAQEALRNALAHARTREIRVRLDRDGADLRLSVEDAGEGFDPSAARRGAGLGLASMAERVRLIGARLEIDSAPGRGTRVSVRVALPGEPHAAAALARDPA